MNDEIVDHLKEGFQLISSDWRYLYVNDAVVAHSRYKREDLLGKTMMEMYPGIENTAMFDVLRHCRDHCLPANFENEFEYPDGHKAWFELRVQPFDQGLVILSIDITRRKRAENITQEYIRDLESLIDFTTHNIRQPVTKLLGIHGYTSSGELSREDLVGLCNIMDRSLSDLDNVTRKLTEKMIELKTRVISV